MAIDVTTTTVAMRSIFPFANCGLSSYDPHVLSVSTKDNSILASVYCNQSVKKSRFCCILWMAPAFRTQFKCQHAYCWTSNYFRKKKFRQKRDHKLNTLWHAKKLSRPLKKYFNFYSTKTKMLQEKYFAKKKLWNSKIF